MARFYDTLLGEYIQNPGERGLSLDDLAMKYFDYDMISYKDVVGKDLKHFGEVSLKDAANYAGEDVYITNKLYQNQKEKKVGEDEILQKIEFPLLQVLSTMERNGVFVSKERLGEIGAYLKQEIQKEQDTIYALTNQEFNISSPKQVGEMLFDTLKLPTGKKTKSGSYSVDTEVLEYLAHTYPIAEHILNFRQYRKLLSTYVEGLQKLINPLTGRIHTTYNQTITTTGRLSSTSPNLQNIPVGSGVGGSIREAFLPFDKEDVLISFDYSQIEVRLLAIMSRDTNLLESFRVGMDIHKNTGMFLFEKDEITSDERKIAKAVNFGVIYGISAFGLSKMTGSSLKESGEYIDKFYQQYPKVREFFDKTITSCEQKGYVETLFGRKRYIPSINDRNKVIKKASEREAINMPIQGTSADIIKLAMIQIDTFLQKNNLKTKMIMQVHDELVFNVPKTEQDTILQEIPRIMETILSDASIVLKVDAGVGKNWRECG